MRMSHSSRGKYATCPYSYYLHYIKKIRPNWTSSALLFGDALDKAINELLLKTDNLPYETFLKGWTNGFINKKPVYLPTSESLLYANKDYNSNLLTKDDYDEIDKRVKSGELEDHEYGELVDRKKQFGWEKLSTQQKRYFNFVNWLCMKNKAKYILEGYEKQILPKLTKIHAVQKEFNVDNGQGDSLTGFIDLIADVEGHGTVILDNKSSARLYDWDSPSKSPQLALYEHIEGSTYQTSKVGFIVMLKQLKDNKQKTCKSCGHVGQGTHKTCDNVVNTKRCGGEWDEVIKLEADFQFLVQEVDKSFGNMTMESMDETAQAINANIFPKNLSSCYDSFGSDCIYLKYCLSSCKNKTGLTEETE